MSPEDGLIWWVFLFILAGIGLLMWSLALLACSEFTLYILRSWGSFLDERRQAAEKKAKESGLEIVEVRGERAYDYWFGRVKKAKKAVG